MYKMLKKYVNHSLQPAYILEVRQAILKVSKLRTGYIICRAQRQLKTQGPCSKVITNLKMVLAEHKTKLGAMKLVLSKLICNVRVYIMSEK